MNSYDVLNPNGNGYIRTTDRYPSSIITIASLSKRYGTR